MYETLVVRIVGIAPLVMHNGQTADPLNKFAKAMSEITGRRKKTEADYARLSLVEYTAALYMDAKGPVIPARMIEAALVAGARKTNAGKLVQAGVIVEKNAPLEYDGPRTVQELFDDERFKLVAPVRVKQQKVIRTRPIFSEWSIEIEVKYLGDVINSRDMITAIRNAGAYCGFGDWRPRYGRFAIESDLPVAMAAE